MHTPRQEHPIRIEIDRLLEPTQYNAQSFLRSFSELLQVGDKFNLQATREGYSVGEHTVIFLLQMEKYFPNGFPGLSLRASRLLGALHDIGKRHSTDTREQHSHTVEFIQSYRSLLPITDDEFRIILAVVSEDSLGGLIKDSTLGAEWDDRVNLAISYHVRELDLGEVYSLVEKTRLSPDEEVRQTLKTATLKLLEQSRRANMSPERFLELMVAFTQIDISCYTIDASRDPLRTFENKELWMDDDQIQVPIFMSPAAKACRAYERARGTARCIPSLEGVFRISPKLLTIDPYSYDGSRLIEVSDLTKRPIFSPPVATLIEQLENNIRSAHLHTPLRAEAEWCELDVGDWGEPFRQPIEITSETDSILEQIRLTTGHDLSGLSENARKGLYYRDMRSYGEEPFGHNIADSPWKVFRAMDELLINETGFFREVLDWDYLQNEVLPRILSSEGEIRIASIGCSTGEECYSIAALVKALAPNRKVIIYGYDLDGESLSKARGRSTDQRFLNDASRSLSIKLELRGIQPNTVKAKTLAEMMEYHQINILQESPKEGPFDLIVCASLLPHYDEQTQEKIRKLIESNLKENGEVVYEVPYY